jgi:hypothetical protein
MHMPQLVQSVSFSSRPNAGLIDASMLRLVDSMAVTPITSSQTRVQRLHMMQRSHL